MALDNDKTSGTGPGKVRYVDGPIQDVLDVYQATKHQDRRGFGHTATAGKVWALVNKAEAP